MAKVTDEIRKKIILDYVECENYTTVAKKYGISRTTVTEIVKNDKETCEKLRIKKRENAQSVCEHLEKSRDKAIDLIDKCLKELSSESRLKTTGTKDLATTFGIIVDKFTRSGFSDADGSAGYHGIPALSVAPAFAPVLFDIDDHGHTEYVFPGGRGSTKSSFISLSVIDLLKKNREMHACVLRNVGNTLKDSVYAQILWAISTLGLDEQFTYTRSPLEITCIETGQKIFFRGADDPNKIKSIKPPFGYIGILWFEELDQFSGEEAVRKIEQSVIRGGDRAYKFKSFNPPKSALNWANKYIKIPRDDRLVTESTYLSVPVKWLGKPFMDDAEFLKATNPTAYENEYLGEANGTGGNVFDNVVAENITDEQIAEFDRVLNGVDWGWYPDPFAFNRCYYDAARLTLYIYDEFHANKMSNERTANVLVQAHGITASDKVICDSAEPKSIDDYKAYGLLARPAQKGPDSVKYSIKWLQSLVRIVIDPVRCPETVKEFINYEYDRDKDGNIISGYPDRNNHHIDAVRYATNDIWKKRGQ